MCFPTEFRRKMILQIIEALKESPSFRDIALSQIKEAVLNSEHQTFQQSKTKEEYIYFINEKIKKIQKSSECKSFDRNVTDVNFSTNPNHQMAQNTGMNNRYSKFEMNNEKESNDYDKAKIINGKIPAHVNISQIYSQEQPTQYSNLGRKMETFGSSFEQAKRNTEMNIEKNNMNFNHPPYQEYVTNVVKPNYSNQEYYKMNNTGYVEQPPYSYEPNNNQYAGNGIPSNPQSLPPNYHQQSQIPINYSQQGQMPNNIQQPYNPNSILQNYTQGYQQNNRPIGYNQQPNGNYKPSAPTTYPNTMNSGNPRYSQFANRSFPNQQNEGFGINEDYNGKYSRAGQGADKYNQGFQPNRQNNVEMPVYPVPSQQPNQFSGFSSYTPVERPSNNYGNREVNSRMDSFMNRPQNPNETKKMQGYSNERSMYPENNLGSNGIGIKIEDSTCFNSNEYAYGSNKAAQSNKSFIGNINPNLYDPTIASPKIKNFSDKQNEQGMQSKNKNFIFDDKKTEEIFKSIGEEFAKSGKFAGLDNHSAKNIFGNESISSIFGNAIKSDDSFNKRPVINKVDAGNYVDDDEFCKTVQPKSVTYDMPIAMNKESEYNLFDNSRNPRAGAKTVCKEKNEFILENELFTSVRATPRDYITPKNVNGDAFSSRSQKTCIKAERKSGNGNFSSSMKSVHSGDFSNSVKSVNSGNSTNSDSNTFTSRSMPNSNFKESFGAEKTILKTNDAESPEEQYATGSSNNSNNFLDAFVNTNLQQPEDAIEEANEDAILAESGEIRDVNDSLCSFLDSNTLFPFKPVNDELLLSDDNDEVEIPEELSNFLKQNSLTLKEFKNEEIWKYKLNEAYAKIKENIKFDTKMIADLLETQRKFINFCFLDEQDIDNHLNDILFSENVAESQNF